MSNTTEDNVREALAFGHSEMVTALTELVKSKDRAIAFLRESIRAHDDLIKIQEQRIAELESQVTDMADKLADSRNQASELKVRK